MTVKEKMKSLFKPFRPEFRLASAALACILFASCSDEPGPAPDPGPVSDRDVWLSVDIRNHKAARSIPPGRGAAPADPDKHPDEAAEPAENYVDVSDLSILLFDADNRLVRIFNSNEFNVTADNAATGDYRLLLKTTTERLGIADATSGSVTFTMLMMANMQGTGSGDGPFPYTSLLSTVADLSQTRRGFGYSGTAGTAAWTPDIAAGRLIPMSGTVTADVDVAALKAGNTATNAVQLPTIYLQRAMAKVRLIDAIEDTNFEITDVRLRGYANRGAYLPALEAGSPWALNTQVVEYASSLPSWYQSAGQLPSQKFTYTNIRSDISLKPGSHYDSFRFYVPEFKSNGTGEPTFEITVHDNTSGKDLSYEYKFPHTAAGTVPDMVRNHIYEVIVTGVSAETDVKLNIKYGICPWEDHTVEIPEFHSPRPYTSRNPQKR